MQVVVEGVVMEVRERQKGGVEYRLFVSGERELLSVFSKDDGFGEGEKVKVEGRVFAMAFGRAARLAVSAERIVGVSPP